MRDTPLFCSKDPEALETVIDRLGDAVCVSDRNMVFVGANRNFAAFYGFDHPDKILGKSAFDVYPQFEKSVFYQACKHTVDTGEMAQRVGYSANLQNWIVMRSGKIGEDRYAMVVHRLAGRASTTGVVSLVDDLTSLPNRVAYDRDNAVVDDYSQQAVALLDISHFKHFNETLGHQNGDRCLMEVGARLLQGLTQSDRAYRIGNDRFLVLGTNGAEALKDTMRAVLAHLGRPMNFGGTDYVLHFNTGIADSVQGEDPEHLLNKAEQALTRAKVRKSGWEEYQPGKASPYDLTQVKALHEALDEKQMVLFLQPQIDLVDGCVVGAEALVRWQHPTRGLRGPADFLPLVEEAGLNGALDTLVLERAFEVLEQWRDTGLPLQLSVNLSSMSVGDRATVKLVADHLQRTGIEPARLCLEITESALIEDVEASQAVIEGLKQLGVEIALDDFGTGYCSMAYLLRYPSQFLKIDRSFIQDFDQSETKQITVRNIIALAHGLGIGVVAEGVEREEELALLKHMNCDLSQGYFHAKPMPVPDFHAWISTRPFAPLASAIR